MCDCEELEIEDFELMLAAIAKTARLRAEEERAGLKVPQLVVAR